MASGAVARAEPAEELESAPGRALDACVARNPLQKAAPSKARRQIVRVDPRGRYGESDSNIFEIPGARHGASPSNPIHLFRLIFGIIGTHSQSRKEAYRSCYTPPQQIGSDPWTNERLFRRQQAGTPPALPFLRHTRRRERYEMPSMRRKLDVLDGSCEPVIGKTVPDYRPRDLRNSRIQLSALHGKSARYDAREWTSATRWRRNFCHLRDRRHRRHCAPKIRRVSAVI